ncbi:hypothetical protein RND71_042290 [Anisodus tanguticus]|uniref:Uncharacterized protein n=1 Tax=Anisodus tanguticus TaxID=243964 RepID=A0AAE1QS80_9SOLA|nr:hypothetical protein RND71_042290 [Anisodus tanguticus]
MWWVVPCTSMKSLRTKSRMNIEEILKMKLATTKEEPHEDKLSTIRRSKAKKMKKIHFKVKMGEMFTPQFILTKESYVMLFMTNVC